jgi:hypothetical protein
MMVTATQAFAAVKARLNAGSYSFPLYYHGDDPPALPDVPSPFAFIVFNNEGSIPVSFGGGRGSTVYRNRARVEAFMFLPAWQGLEMAMDYAEVIAVRLRSFRDDFISCFQSDVIPVGLGSTLSVPGLSSEVSNYQCAIAESMLIFDQSGGAIVDPVPPDGGGTPDWVPANAKIHIDLIGNRAWSDGAAVAVDTLLGSDPNTANAWGPSLYDPAKLMADGYVTDGNDAPALIGNALIKVLDAATIVVRTKRVTTDAFGFSPVVSVSADGNDAVELDLQSNGVAEASSYNGSLAITISDVVNVGLGSVNCAAVTVTVDRFDLAVNGSSAVAGVLASDDRPVDNPLVAAIVDPNKNNAIQSITIYDPLPDTTGLSELSMPL